MYKIKGGTTINFLIVWRHTTLTPPPVTNCHTSLDPPPWSVTSYMDGPLSQCLGCLHCHRVTMSHCLHCHDVSAVYTVSMSRLFTLSRCLIVHIVTMSRLFTLSQCLGCLHCHDVSLCTMSRCLIVYTVTISQLVLMSVVSIHLPLVYIPLMVYSEATSHNKRNTIYTVSCSAYNYYNMLHYFILYV